MDFGKKLENELKTQKITPYELAKKTKIKKQSIYNYINGIQEPSISKLYKICIALDVSADYLLGLKEY